VLTELAAALNTRPDGLLDQLGMPGRPAPARPARQRRPLHTQVGVTATIRIDGQRTDPVTALLHLARLEPDR
jgi:hypothetical protein